MQLLQQAELISETCRYIAQVKLLIEEKEKRVITAVPKKRGEYIFFYPEEELTLHFTSASRITFYKVRFQEIKLIKKSIYYVFSILSFFEIDNIRKEERKYVECPAILQDQNITKLGTILDMSENGMKIETKKPLEQPFVQILFERKNKHIYVQGEIMWTKKIGNLYYYGMKTNNVGVIEHESRANA